MLIDLDISLVSILYIFIYAYKKGTKKPLKEAAKKKLFKCETS